MDSSLKKKRFSRQYFINRKTQVGKRDNLFPQNNSLEVTYLESEVIEFFPCGHTTNHEKCVVYHLKYIKLRWYFK